MPKKTHEDESPFLFHVTYYGRIGTILDRGLVPGNARAIGGSAYDGHARGRIFLTDDSGISFWFQRAKDHAEHNSDAPIDDMLVPVVLRVDTRKLDHDKIGDDGVGTDDAKHPAYFYPEAIAPGAIEVWDGSQWDPVEEAEEFMPGPEVGGTVTEEETDGERYQIQSLLSYSKMLGGVSPFYPPESEWHTEYNE